MKISRNSKINAFVMRNLVFSFVCVFLLLPLQISWSQEQRSEKFTSIENILLGNGVFKNIQESSKKEFLGVVQECEASDFVKTPFNDMSARRIVRLASLLHNWITFSVESQLPIDIQKKQLKDILSTHLFSPVFVASTEDSNIVKSQLGSILKLLESAQKPQNVKNAFKPILGRFTESTSDDMTPLFKYPLSRDAFERLSEEICNVIDLAVFDDTPHNEFPRLSSVSRFEGLIVQSYMDAVPENIHNESEKTMANIKMFADSENLSEDIVSILHSQQKEAIESFEKKFYDDFARQAAMIQLQENGVVLEGNVEIEKSQTFSSVRIFFIVTGLLLIFIALIRIVFRICTK